VTLVEKTFKVDGKIIKVVIWDTAGQETFRSMTRSYYRGAHGAIVVFDITNANTFAQVGHWLDDLRDQSENAQVVLVGNKTDLPYRQIERSEGLTFAQKYSLNYMETSAKSGNNVNKAFQILLTDIHKMALRETEGDIIPRVPSSNSSTVILTADPPKEVQQKKDECSC